MGTPKHILAHRQGLQGESSDTVSGQRAPEAPGVESLGGPAAAQVTECPGGAPACSAEAASWTTGVRCCAQLIQYDEVLFWISLGLTGSAEVQGQHLCLLHRLF